MKGIIISGFAGIGKTTIVDKYQGRIIDLESSDFKWIYEDDATAMLKEERKGVANRKLNPEWPKNYMKAILEATEKFEFILIAQGKDIRNLLEENEIEYFITFPALECKQEYLERYQARGNQPDFVELIKVNFEKWVQELMECPQRKLIMKPGQYLEDIMKEQGLIK